MLRSHLWTKLVGAFLVAGALIAAILQVGVAGAATPATGGRCSLATLHGTYLAYVTGWTLGGPEPVPFAFAYQESYDGKGKDTGIYTYSSGGTVYRNVAFSGTYAVNANCTGVESDTDALGSTSSSDNFIAPDGSQMTFTSTIASQVSSGSQSRVSGGP